MQVATAPSSPSNEAGPLCIITEAEPPILAPVPEPPQLDFLALMQQLPEVGNIGSMEVFMQQQQFFCVDPSISHVQALVGETDQKFRELQ